MATEKPNLCGHRTLRHAQARLTELMAPHIARVRDEGVWRSRFAGDDLNEVTRYVLTHSEASTKLESGIASIGVGRGPGIKTADNFCLYVSRRDGSDVAMSRHNLFCSERRVAGRGKQRLMPPLRQAVAQQILDYRLSQADLFPECPCGGRADSVDHTPAFVTLAGMWLESENLTHADVVLTIGRDGLNALPEPLLTRWQAFHHAHARLTMLCTRCNSRKGVLEAVV